MPIKSTAVKTSVSVTMVAPGVTVLPTIGASSSTIDASPNHTQTNGENDGAVAMSPGAIAGIAVGSTLGVVALIAGAFFMWHRRRKARHAHGQDSTTPPAALLMGTGAFTNLPLDEKRNLGVPGTPSFFSNRGGVHRPLSVVSSGYPTPSPMGTPNTPASPCYGQGLHATHAELSDESRVVYEMPAINERVEAP